jgi:hypothetical protein
MMKIDNPFRIFAEIKTSHTGNGIQENSEKTFLSVDNNSCPTVSIPSTSPRANNLFSSRQAMLPNQVTCGYCLETSLNDDEIETHLVRDHGIKWPTISICYHCGTCFGSNIEYSKHRLQSHPVQIETEIYTPCHRSFSQEPALAGSGEVLRSSYRDNIKFQDPIECDRMLKSLLNMLQLPALDGSFVENIYQF